MQRVSRGGRYFRVVDPTWTDPSSTAYSLLFGGRWNPPGEFGALYLNATIAASLANAEGHVESILGPFGTVYDLLPALRPQLQHYDIATHEFVDVVTPSGIVAAGLPPTYPDGVPHAACQAVARLAYEAGEAGIAAVSARVSAEEELAIFDRDVVTLATERQREPYAVWAP